MAEKPKITAEELLIKSKLFYKSYWGTKEVNFDDVIFLMEEYHKLQSK